MSMRARPVTGQLGVALATVLLAGSAASAYVPTFRTVALSGPLAGADVQYGPGTGLVTEFVTLDGQPSINFAGHVAFRAAATVAATSVQGMWVSDGNLLANTNSVQALGGQAQPGGGTYPTGTVAINSPSINNAGQFAFRLGSQAGLFSNIGGGMSRVALAGDLAPGTGGATYAASAVATGTPLFNQAGQTAYLGTLTTGSGTPAVTFTSPNANQTCVYIGTGSNAGGANPNVTLALRAADQPSAVTAIDPALKIGGSFSAGTMSFNGAGEYVVVNTLQGTIGGTAVATSSTAGNANSIISNRGGSFGIIARQGTVAPDALGGTGGTNVYRTLPTSSIIGFNDLGHVAYTATLRNGATQTSTGALFTDAAGAGGGLRMYANIGQAMPQVYSSTGAALGEFTGVNWGAMTGTTLLTASDQLIFSASGLNGAGITLNTNDSGVFRLEAGGNLTKLLRAGDAIPMFTPLGSGEFCKLSSMPSSMACNSLGQIAWSGIANSNLGAAGLVNGAIGNNSALWAMDVDGTVYCIAQKGELFHVGPGDDRVVSAVNGVVSSGGQDGRVRSFNDLGDLSFSLAFADGTSGVFVTHVPTPGSLALLGLGGLIASRRRRA